MGRVELAPPAQFSAEELLQSTIFVESQRTSHPFQLPAWSCEETSCYAVVRDEMRLRLFARCDTVWPLGQRLRRVRSMTLTHGPVCDDPSLMQSSLEELAEECRSRGFLYLDVNPEVADSDADKLGVWLNDHGWFGRGPARASLWVDLRPGPAEIHASFRKTTRHEIRRSESAEVRIEETGDDLSCERFLSLYAAMMQEKRLTPEPAAHMRQVLAWVTKEPKRGVLLLASHRGEAMGGVVVVRAGSRSWYVWGATKKQAEVNVGHLLQWRAMNWAKQQGCTEYDLGGYRIAARDGPALFKRGFSDTVVRFLPTYRCVTNPAAYAAFRMIHGGVHTARRVIVFGNMRKGLSKTR